MVAKFTTGAVVEIINWKIHQKYALSWAVSSSTNE